MFTNILIIKDPVSFADLINNFNLWVVLLQLISSLIRWGRPDLGLHALHHDLKTATDLELLKEVYSNGQSVVKFYSDGPLLLLTKTSLYVNSDGHAL